MQNPLTRAVTHTPVHAYVTLALKSLRWLKDKQRMQFKTIYITHNLLHKSEPSYRCSVIHTKPTYKTCSSNHLCLSLPPLTFKLKFSERSFHNSFPLLLNSLPTNLWSFSQLSSASTTTSHSLTPFHFAVLSLSRHQLLSCLNTHPFVLSYLFNSFCAFTYSTTFNR